MTRRIQKGSEPSQRMLRVAELFRQSVAALLARGGLNDPALDGAVITVSAVRMSPDLKLATVYLMPVADGRAEKIIAALERHKKQMRSVLAHRINLKFAPDLVFRIDSGFEKSLRIDELLNSPMVRRDVESGGGKTDD